MVLDKEKLKQIAHDNPRTKAFLEHMANRERPRSETTVSRTVRILKDANINVTRIEAEHVLKDLASTGAGTLSPGRNGRTKKLEWESDLREVGCIALGKIRSVRPKTKVIPPIVDVKEYEPPGGRMVIRGENGVTIEVSTNADDEVIKNIIQAIRSA